MRTVSLLTTSCECSGGWNGLAMLWAGVSTTRANTEKNTAATTFLLPLEITRVGGSHSSNLRQLSLLHFPFFQSDLFSQFWPQKND